VYRARDTKLHRDVALKTLPESSTHDLERVARFRRVGGEMPIVPQRRLNDPSLHSSKPNPHPGPPGFSHGR